MVEPGPGHVRPHDGRGVVARRVEALDHSAVLPQQIEAVALRPWSERGFHEVSVAEVGVVAARTIFRRYPTKADIVWGPLTASHQLWRQSLYDFAVAPPGVDALRAQVFAWSVESTALAGLIWWVTRNPGTAPWPAVDEAFAHLMD